MCYHLQGEPTYSEVTSNPGPVARPRPSVEKKPAAEDVTYAPIVHNKKGKP